VTKPPSIFISFAHGLNAAREVTGKKDLPIQHLMVLLEVIDIAVTGALVKKGDVAPVRTAKALAEPWNLTSDGVSKVLRALELDYGYVSSRIDPQDRRSRHYYPTPSGRKFAIQWASLRGTDVTGIPMEVLTPAKEPKIKT
jgi:DNA-binding MarR family transcriptional regulator